MAGRVDGRAADGLPVEGLAGVVGSGAVDGVGGAGSVVADLLGDELLPGDGLPVLVRVFVVVDVAFGDELVALGERGVGAFGGAPVVRLIAEAETLEGLS